MKIQKISTYIWWALAALSVILFVLYYGLGFEEKGGSKKPILDDILLVYMYILVVVAAVLVLATAAYAIFKYWDKGLAVVIGCTVGTPLIYKGLYYVCLNSMESEYKTPEAMSDGACADAWIYLIYVLFIATVGAVIYSSVRTKLK